MDSGYPLPCNSTDAAGGASFDAIIAQYLRERGAFAHPGLLLDRFVEYSHIGTSDPSRLQFNQENQKRHLDLVVDHSNRCARSKKDLPTAWDDMCRATNAHTWSQTTIWRLALHLSRATALENASLCLHPVYGFPYIPGTGLKGLACAAAELLDGRPKLGDPDCQRVFGEQSGAGSVVFQDAWPVKWPQIDTDIVNNHHPDYYSSEGGSAPGDWESPGPVYFLTVAPGAQFRFAIAPRTLETAPTDVDLACCWLKRGLQELGAGAKTAAGYGYFRKPEEYDLPAPVAPPDPREAEWPEEVRDLASRFREWLSDGADSATRGNFLNLLENLATEDKRRAIEWMLEQIEGMDELTTDRETKSGRKPSFASQLRERLP